MTPAKTRVLYRQIPRKRLVRSFPGGIIHIVRCFAFSGGKFSPSSLMPNLRPGKQFIYNNSKPFHSNA